MNNEYEVNNMCKEALVILSYCNNEIRDKIPNKIINKLKEFAKDSNNNFKIDFNKSLENQNISNDGKNLISLIYYNYIASDLDKEEIKNTWAKNEDNINKIFIKDIKDKKENQLIVKKENIFKIIINKIKNFSKKRLNKNIKNKRKK